MDLRDLFFPRSCLSCNKSGKYLCLQCMSKVQKSRETCPACNQYSFSGKTHTSCKKLIKMDGHLSVWRYQGIIRNGVHALKYRFASDVAGEFVDNIQEWRIQNCVLIPVPLHYKRENWRGFNQSSLISTKLTKKFNLVCAENILIRIENTTPQAHLGKSERVQNIRGKFAVKEPFSLTKQTIVLVDDVWTTGSTMKECSKVLKKAGAKEVWGWTLAS